MKEETVREKFGILCRDSSRFTQHIMIFSLGTTASRYRRLHNYASPRYFLCDHIGYTIDHYFTTCSLVFLYTSFNEEGMVSSAKLKRCRFSGSTDKKTKVRWNAIHVCRFVLSFLAIFRADDALTTRFFQEWFFTNKVCSRLGCSHFLLNTTHGDIWLWVYRDEFYEIRVFIAFFKISYRCE